MTHKLSIPQHVVQMVTERIGRAHPFDVIDPKKTALLVVDMQNYFMHPDYQAVPMAREIVPNVNRLAGIVRAAGGHVVCCESTARDAMMLNYKVVMVHDALAAYTEAEHNATLATFYMIFGDVQSIDEVAASMQRGGAPAAVAS